jgi:23S rRNA pseudouridine1911/1915/1917 synthase
MNQPFIILFEDDSIVVLNKIAKLLTTPTVHNEKNTLTSLLKEHLKRNVYPCHRLDRETSGVIVFAKSSAMQEKVMAQFKKGNIKKCYMAFVKGKMPKNGTMEGEIIDKEGEKYGEEKKYAKTLYHTVQAGEDFSVVDLTPMTGRTNQLRIQLSEAGHPILGEDKYAFRRDFEVNFKRLALHAYYLRFSHPISNERMEFRLDIPQDMADFLRGGR